MPAAGARARGWNVVPAAPAASEPRVWGSEQAPLAAELGGMCALPAASTGVSLGRRSTLHAALWEQHGLTMPALPCRPPVPARGGPLADAES